MLGLLIGTCALLGLAVGSFLNVVIYRMPRGGSIVSPRSKCPSCDTPIRSYDNIPLISWLVLRGRCRHCRSPISARYPLVELSCGILFAGLAARQGFHWELPAFLALFAGLLALSFIDAEFLILPKRVVYPTLALETSFFVLAAAVTGEWRKLIIASICAIAWFLAFFLLNFASPRILGFGDVRLSPAIGFGLGWLGWRYVILGFFAANVIGAAIGLTFIASKKMKRDQQIPYGVFLSLGAAFATFAGPEVVNVFQKVH